MRKFGAAVQARQVLVDRGFRGAILQHCDEVIPELEFKWSAVEDVEGRFDLVGAWQIVNFAKSHGLRVHGHALLWHKSIPSWLLGRMIDSDGVWPFVERYFERLVAPFAGLVTSWDVVNEPIETGPREDGLRQQPFLKVLGPDYIARAFSLARRHAPRAKLYANEYGLLNDDPASQAKRSAVLRMIQAVQGQNAPIDGLGIQAHLDLENIDRFDPGSFAKFLEELAGLSVSFRISELDVRESDTTLPVEERDRRVAEATRQVVDVASAAPNFSGIACWGLSDRYSWLPVQSETSGLNRGLPLDSDLRAKPMLRAVADAIET